LWRAKEKRKFWTIFLLTFILGRIKKDTIISPKKITGVKEEGFFDGKNFMNDEI
jgi:hypothetical protein